VSSTPCIRVRKRVIYSGEERILSRSDSWGMPRKGYLCLGILGLSARRGRGCSGGSGPPTLFPEGSTKSSEEAHTRKGTFYTESGVPTPRERCCTWLYMLEGERGSGNVGGTVEMGRSPMEHQWRRRASGSCLTLRNEGGGSKAD